MSSFFGALTTLCLIAFVVGMVKPKFIMRWAPEAKQNRKWVAIITIVGMVVFSGLAANTMTPEEKAAQQARQEQQKKDLEAKKQAEADKKAAEEQAAAEKKDAEEKAAAEKAAAETKQKAADYNTLYNQVMAALQPADDAMQARKDVAAAGDFVGMINKMAAEKEAIATAKANLNNLSAPSSFDSEDKENLQKGKESLNQAMDQRDAFIVYMARYIQNQSKTDFEMAQQSIQKSDASMMAGFAYIVTIGQKYNAN